MTRGGPTVLIVEDDPNDVLLLQRAFSKVSVPHDLRIARDGEEALDYLEGAGPYADRAAHPLPCLVLLDLKLPRRSGLEVLEGIRRTPALSGLPVIILTSSREESDIQRAYERGANSYLVKPVGFEGLLDLVRELAGYWLSLNRRADA